MDDFKALLAQYEHNAVAVAGLRHTLGKMELDLSDYVIAGANALLGGHNPKTEKPHSWTSAEKEAKEHPEYREQQLNILTAKAEVERCEAKVRAMWLRARMMIATREGGVVEVAA